MIDFEKNIRLIRRKEVQYKTGLATSSIYHLMQKNDFPKTIQLSVRRVAWVESEVDEWVESRISKSKFNKVCGGDQ